MMTFLIPGYGIPSDILLDENYGRYLGHCFNAIFEKRRSLPAVIVFSGGYTDMVAPYRRTEAGEMIRHFQQLMNRPFVHQATKQWKLVKEVKALSTLENLVFTKVILEKKGLHVIPIVVFCEYTRRRRMRANVRSVFGRSAKVHPIDFDLSLNRYHDPAFLHKKEQTALELDAWSRQSDDNFQAAHKLYKKKIAFLREQGPNAHADAIKDWWDIQLEQLRD